MGHPDAARAPDKVKNFCTSNPTCPKCDPEREQDQAEIKKNDC